MKIIKHVYRGSARVSVVLSLEGQPGNATAHRNGSNFAIRNDKETWTWKEPAVVTWSGGNGAESFEHAKAFGVLIILAAVIAEGLSEVNPDNLTDEEILNLSGSHNV